MRTHGLAQLTHTRPSPSGIPLLLSREQDFSANWQTTQHACPGTKNMSITHQESNPEASFPPQRHRLHRVTRYKVPRCFRATYLNL
ncbi:uncharacterized protein LY79DRAFT_225654 [Colletotrichum navitas]|uniref:Uncharacterized protein n=1 Tax=Colletotrichum navitas TaxID=681940 RepID=A0AAD8PY47_9PEZI|nr:uncharacterized protein LY79DRAFT_225654 [Colletotrichum navitas]KAK1590240.1 hypothetical protein LY79DRAFT_225654 [Colletotrichum navitas]